MFITKTRKNVFTQHTYLVSFLALYRATDETNLYRAKFILTRQIYVELHKFVYEISEMQTKLKFQ